MKAFCCNGFDGCGQALYSKDFSVEWKKCSFAILIILALGGLIAAGFGLNHLGGQQGWWQGATYQLSKSHSISLLTVGAAAGIGFLSVGLFIAITNRQAGLQTSEKEQAARTLSKEEQEALDFAEETLKKFPELKEASLGFFEENGQPVINEKISKLCSFFSEFSWPDVMKKLKENKHLEDLEVLCAFDTCLKVSYAIVYYIYEEVLSSQKSFVFQEARQIQLILAHACVYNVIRHTSNQNNVDLFYQEGEKCCEWRTLFNAHCDLLAQKGIRFIDSKYMAWLQKDTKENPLKRLDSKGLPRIK